MQNANDDMSSVSASSDERGARERLLSLWQTALRQREGAGAPILVRKERTDPVPLSYAQERLWFLNELGLVGAAYNILFVLRLQGCMVEEALERSLLEIVHRHEALRTRFGSRDGIPYQIIDPTPRRFQLRREDLSHIFDVERRESELRELMHHEQQLPLDLSNGCPMRAVLVRLSEGEHAVLITIHHIAFDGWSRGVLVRELSALYAAYVRGQSSPLEELSIQYPDYAIWQREWLRGDVLQELLQYWRQQLVDAPTQLQLPSDRPRPTVESYRGATLHFRLSAESSSALKELARREGVTLFTACLAAYQLLMSRWSGQQDIVVGSPVAGRRQREVEGLIGFFVNVLVLRTDLSGRPTVRQLLQRVKGVTLGAYAHQDLPFETLVKELRPERNLTRQPLFQVALVLQNFPEGRLELPGVSCIWNSAEYVTTHFDLTLCVSEDAEGFSAVFEYATDLFDHATIERMAGHFRTLVDGMIATPECPIDQLPLLTEAESEQLLRWSGAHKELLPDSDVVSCLERHARLQPDASAVCAGDRILSYSQLNAAANRLARRLRLEGVRPGERVGVYMHRGVECVLAFYAILKACAVYVPLDPTYPGERLEHICRDANVRRIILERGGCVTLDVSAIDRVYVDDARDVSIGERIESDIDRPRNPLAPVYAIYTSGSTGRPKGVLLHQLGLANVISAQRRLFGLTANDRVIQLASLSFDASVFEFVLALGAGACLFPGSRDELLPGPNLTAFIRKHAISVATITPSALSSLAPDEPTSLRTLIVAGEEFPVELAQVWSKACRVFNAYGPTEATIWSTTHECSEHALGARLSIGTAVDNVRTYLLDSNLRPVAVGQVGELCVGGHGVALGYINRPDLTAAQFVPDPFANDPGARMYKTGDLGRWRSDGTIEYLGRNDHQIKIRGFRIEPREIETQLARHEQVKEAVVIAREVAAGDKRLVAYMIPVRADNRPTAGALRAHLRAIFPEHFVPSAFVILDSLPLTSNGKLDRRALPVPEPGSYATRDYAPPQGDAEESLAVIWQELLRVPRVGRRDNFFEIGGHSLLATRVIAQMRERLQVELPLKALFDAPTIELLAVRVEVERSARAERDTAWMAGLAEDFRREIEEMDDQQIAAAVAELSAQLTGTVRE